MKPTRKRGRPALDPGDPSVAIYVTVPSRHYDQLYRQASDARVSVPELVRRSLPIGNKKRENSG